MTDQLQRVATAAAPPGCAATPASSSSSLSSPPASHQAFDQLHASRTVEFLRGLLVSQDCLPARDPHLGGFERWIVAKLDKPFREAHHSAAKAVGRAEELGLALDALPLAELKKIEPAITEDVYKVLSLEASVNARQSFGGTAPKGVKDQVGFWKERLA